MSNVTRLPPPGRKVHVEADIPAGLYNGQDYPFDLTELRALDTALGNACLDYLNYDRLGKREVHKHLTNGDSDLHRWMERYGLLPRES